MNIKRTVYIYRSKRLENLADIEKYFWDFPDDEYDRNDPDDVLSVYEHALCQDQWDAAEKDQINYVFVKDDKNKNNETTIDNLNPEKKQETMDENINK